MNFLDMVYALTLGPHFLWHRYISGKYGPKVMEKIGHAPDRFKTSATAALDRRDPHVEPPCLWVHAVSVGEAVASRDLVKMFVEDNPSWDVKVSTTTATGRSIAEKTFGAENVFYYPLDFSAMVARTFDKVRPSLIVLMELEIWPNFLAEAARRGIPVVVANARITERSVKRLALVPWLARRMSLLVQAWYAQTREYAERLERIGVPANRIEVTGSVKYDAVPLELDELVAKHYRRLFGCGEAYFRDGGKLLVVAGSTHPTEEATLLKALAKAMPGSVKPLVVLAPRHPERLDEVEREASTFGKVIRRSRLPEITADSPEWCGADIVLVDTMGELSKLYSAADVVFIGGTLVKHGGQNFIEPCGLAKPTMVGPNLWNFSEPAELLGENGCLRIVDTPEELTGALADWIANPFEAAAVGKRARELLLTQRGAARRMADRLDALARTAARKNSLPKP